MVLCVCKAITEQQVIDFMHKHKLPPKEALKHLGLADDCGICLSAALAQLGGGGAQESDVSPPSPGKRLLP